MTTDLSKLILHTGYNSFKNNTIYTGTKTISGTTSAGTNTKTFTVTLGAIPDLLDVMFNGPTDPNFGLDPRPDTGWFKKGSVWVHTNNAGGGDASNWRLYSKVTSALTVTITAIYVQQFTAGETLTATDFSYRIIDFSIF